MSNYNGKTFGQIIREKREKRGWSQDVLSQKLTISRDVISHWEKEHTQPRLDSLMLVADVFECTIDELVGRTL